MPGVTTAIILFVFVCVLFPRLIANKGQFYAGFLLALVVIVFDTFDTRLGLPGPIITASLQVVSVVLLYMAAGGLSARGLSTDMMGAFEVIRRGETEKEVIIPIGGQKERKKPARQSVGEPGERIDLTTDDSDPYPPKKRSTPKIEDGDGPIPLD
jgi:hypothetical protein